MRWQRLLFGFALLILSAKDSAARIWIPESVPPPDHVTEFRNLLESVRQFEKTLSWKNTDNFKESASKGENLLYWHEKTRIPFSYLDMRAKFVSATTIAGSAKELKLNLEKYDFFLYDNIVYAGNTKITPTLLNRRKSQKSCVETILHEDWHNNAHLPYHLEEASGELIKIVGAAIFLQQESEIDQRLKVQLDWYESINHLHQNLSGIAAQLALGLITATEYQEQKEKRLAEWNKAHRRNANITEICHLHSYSYYFPLMHRLYHATGKDLRKVVQILLNIPVEVLTMSEADLASYLKNGSFARHRDADLVVENYLEQVIEGFNCPTAP